MSSESGHAQLLCVVENLQVGFLAGSKIFLILIFLTLRHNFVIIKILQLLIPSYTTIIITTVAISTATAITTFMYSHLQKYSHHKNIKFQNRKLLLLPIVDSVLPVNLPNAPIVELVSSTLLFM